MGYIKRSDEKEFSLPVINWYTYYPLRVFVAHKTI